MVKMFWMIVGAISVPLVYGFLRTEKFYGGVSIVAPGYISYVSDSYLESVVPLSLDTYSPYKTDHPSLGR